MLFSLRINIVYFWTLFQNVIKCGPGPWCKNVWEPLLYINTLHVFSGIVPTTFGLGGQWPAWWATPWCHCSWDGPCTEWWTNGSTKGSHKSPGTLPIPWLRHLPTYCAVCPALTRLTVKRTPQRTWFDAIVAQIHTHILYIHLGNKKNTYLQNSDPANNWFVRDVTV